MTLEVIFGVKVPDPITCGWSPMEVWEERCL